MLVKRAEDAERRERERQAQAEKDGRLRRVRERAEARQRAREAAKEELRAIVKAWNDAFALEAFFTELSRHAATLDGGAHANLETRIQVARELTGGQDAVDRFLKWKLPPGGKAQDEDAVADEAGTYHDDEDG